jgi:hypothetical protein
MLPVRGPPGVFLPVLLTPGVLPVLCISTIAWRWASGVVRGT